MANLSDGIHKTMKAYNVRGDVIQCRYFGIDDQPCRHKDGNFGWSADYDDHGNQTRFTFLNADGQPTTLADGYATSRMKFDERGNQVEWACFDAHDQPALDNSTGVHKLVQTYDEHGQVIETRWFGLDGLPCAGRDGYAITRTRYDQRGNRIEWACFDTRDRPTVDASFGNHIMRTAYDDRGRVIERRSFGVDGQPCAAKDGYAIVRTQYDELGNQSSLTYFDAQDRPIRTRLVVVQIGPGSIASQIGLLLGDVLWLYDDQDLFQLSDLMRLIKSPGTTPRKLVIHRNGRALDFTVPPGRLGVTLATRAESLLQPPPATEPSTREATP
jgi:YD repeat-containing protein